MSSPRKTVRGTVSQADYDYLVKSLCGGEHGIQSEIISTLFTAFVTSLKPLNIEPFHVNNNTPARIRRLLRATGTVWSQSSISRTANELADK